MAAVAIVVLNWNRPRDTLECLESLLPQVESGRASLIVCDNGSSDDSEAVLLDWIRQRFKALDARGAPPEATVTLVQTGANVGYGEGNNVGIRQALLQSACRYVWVLNNDTVVGDGALEALVECAEAQPEPQVLGCTLVDYADRGTVQCAGGCLYSPVLTRQRDQWGGRSLASLRDVDRAPSLDYVCGAAIFVPREVWRRVGLLSSDYFLYYEELDFARRCRDQGVGLGWCRSSVVYHKRGLSTGSRSEQRRQESWLANYHENLSTLRFTARYHPWLLPVAFTVRLVAKLAVLAASGRWSAYAPLLAAYRDFLLGRWPAVAHADSPRVLFAGERG